MGADPFGQGMLAIGSEDRTELSLSRHTAVTPQAPRWGGDAAPDLMETIEHHQYSGMERLLWRRGFAAFSIKAATYIAPHS